jgi:hypothetical protein
LLQLLSVAGGLGLIVFLFFPADRSTTATGWWSVAQGVLFILVLIGALGLLAFLLDRGGRHLASSGAEAMRKDSRAPVLYLRPFEAETVLTVQERVLARIMDSEVGPLVAVGNPGDRLPQLGAARFYERDFSGGGRNWQLFVREMMLRASLVLIVPGRTVGLAWEIAQCREVLAPQRLVVLISGSKAIYSEFRDIAAQAGLLLPQIAARDFGWSAPSDVIGLITFGSDWTPNFTAFPPQSLLEDYDAEEQERRLRRALAPPMSRLGVVIRQP